MLRNRLPEIEIPEGNPFQNDKLDRKSCADIFINLIKMYYSTGCVIALNGEWGSGKTTFVKMVQQELKNRGAHPLYFNAWKNDYVSDPLIALLSELKEVCPDSSKWDNIIANVGKISLAIGKAILNGTIRNMSGASVDALLAGTDEMGKLLEKNINEFAEQKKTFQDFRKSLQEYIADNSSEKNPVIFFIDELDRCSPKFAVHVLERIKHLFDISNITFVLSVNKKQLGYAVQGYYGSANIDANNYLRRFIDIEYTLPKPSTNVFCQYLYDIYKFENIFMNKSRMQISGLQNDAENFKRIATILISSSKIDFRTADKIYAHTRLALMEFDIKFPIYPNVFFLLCYLRTVNSELYYNIFNRKYKPQELLDEIENFFPLELLEKKEEYDSPARVMMPTIASLIFMYNLDENEVEQINLRKKDGDNQPSIKTKHIDSEIFYNTIILNYNRRHAPLSYILKKIELQEEIKFDKYND
jgi:energy-coupling factor transporter ATP-binding protein EcfA2